ncbi:MULTISPECIES: diphthine--ammonia ligase [Acinetobacter]|uniref:Dph6-related ATP pyrophosphatase n=1 Tax=Acinetobacter TaxID=469 RepID=UPI00143A98E2|nr:MULTISPECIES: diphthine--ammonia ligase [Acinetobacter]MDD0802814.1 diphthine--ammonia ligase [Acinetobacter sp. Gutcm_16]NKG37956.1 ATPase [Acinetobacter johnsonii]
MLTQWNTRAQNRKFVASYSGGKDSSLALYQAMQMGEPVALIVMLEEQGLKSRSHGMSLGIIHAQAKAIGLPIYSASATWQDYENQFIQLLRKAQALGAESLVTGDIDLMAHAEWNQSVCDKSELSLCMPLWQRPRLDIVREFIQLGFQSIIVTVNLNLGMKVEDLGRALNLEFVNELTARGIDPCGEAGEFHTTVIDGPIFKHPLSVIKGDILYHENYAFLPLTLEQHDI